MKSTSNIFTNPQFPEQHAETRKYYLMLKDKVLMKVTGSEIEVYERSLLPLALRGKQYVNYADFHKWLDRRVLPFNRENYKMLINNLGLDQGDNFGIALSCKALSLTDCYWVKTDKEKDLKWEDINLYTNKFSKSVGLLAFTGHTPISVTGEFITPELTNLGIFAKCWVREDNGLYLYKANTVTGKESEVEYVVSKLLEASGVNHVPYDITSYEGKTATKCKNITDQNIMIVPANEMIQFFSDLGKHPLEQINLRYNQEFNTMLIIDYIINNYDRHTYNWGFLMDAHTGNVTGMHSLFDHNCALNFSQEDHKSITYNSKTMREVALNSCTRITDTEFINKILKYLESDSGYNLFNSLFDFKNEWIKVRNRCLELINHTK